MTAAIEEVERRVRGGIKGVAAAEARITSARTRDDVVQQVRENSPILAVAGVVVAGAVVYGAFALVNGLRTRNKPQNRLKRRVRSAGGELSERLQHGVEESRERFERAKQRGVLLKLDPEDNGYVRVTDARFEPLKKKRGQSTVIKKFVWAGMLSVILAVASVVARRVADNVWRAMVHEDPPGTETKVKK
jgi:hypothetical protein